MNLLQRTLLPLAAGFFICPGSYASTARGDIPYQTYRDFAENKGAFKPGAVNIPVYNKNGQLTGTLNKAPMPDFSSVNSVHWPGVATLIDPQHIVSVAHNGGYNGVSFGGTGNNPDYHRTFYSIVNRNNSPSRDFHVPRLNKLVTDVIPATMTTAFSYNAYRNQKRFPVFYRTGSGTQYTLQTSGKKTLVGGAYNYLTGGTVGSPGISDWSFVSATQNVFDRANGPLGSYGEAGDSGSPLFGWDSDRNTWVLVGVLDSTIPGGNRWVILLPDFIAGVFNKDKEAPVSLHAPDGTLHWSFNAASGQGSLVLAGHPGSAWEMHGLRGKNPDTGKNLVFMGEDGTIILDDSISQGAGSLTFNSNYVVIPESNQTWQGAGIVTAQGKTVDWQVNGVSGDSLHKIGAGTLRVHGLGVNPGDLNVGDGTVILAQRPGDGGQVQAFKTVTLVSGRPTVVLSDDRQVNPNNIFFGYRGGRLDINGNDLSLSRFKAVDSGAQVVNHNTQKAASVTLTGNGINNTNPFQMFPGTLGETDTALTNGKLSLHYRPASAQGILALTGAARVNGGLFVDNGTVLLSGASVLHAGNTRLNDWDPSGFVFSRIGVSAGQTLEIGEYASVMADITAEKGSHLSVGYNPGVDGVKNHQCTMNDNTGVVSCAVVSLNEEQRQKLPYSALTGDITLADGTALSLGKAVYTGSVQGGAGSSVSLNTDSRWQMVSDSHLGSLSMKKGARIWLGEDNGHGQLFSGKTLTVNGNLTGEGHFLLRTDLAHWHGDRVVVNGLAEGRYTLSVKDDGGDPVQNGKMFTLLSLNNPAQNFDRVNISLAGGYTDVGTWRYRLGREGKDFKLYNPLTPWLPLLPAIANKPDVPDVPATPGVPDVPDVPAAPGVPDVPDVPAAPGVPDAPDVPATPGVPDMPGNAQAEWLSHRANTAVSDYTSHFNMLTRQGESTVSYLNQLSADRGGFWLNIRGDSLRYHDNSYRGYSQHLTTRSMGADRQTLTEYGTWLWGGSLINTVSGASFDEGARARDSAAGVNVYGKFILNSGASLAGFIGGHALNYELTDGHTSIQQNRFTGIAGLSIGQTWLIPGHIRLQPEAGMTDYLIPSSSYRSDKMTVSSAKHNVQQYHAGLRVSRDYRYSDVILTPYVQVSQKMNRNTEQRLHVNDQILRAGLYENKTEVGYGTRVKVNDDITLALQGGFVRGGSMSHSESVSFNVRYSW